MSVIDKAKAIAREFDEGSSKSKLRQCFQEFKHLLILGLKEDGHDMPCIPSFVTDVPTGKETGTFLAMDLGGTNIRACSVELQGNGKFNIIQSKKTVPEEVQTAQTSKELFGFIAEHLKQFLKQYNLRWQKAPGMSVKDCYRLGFTFSFPVIQTNINSGRLLRWTKGFNIQETIGKDVIQILQAEIDARNLPVHISAIVNDTVGTLMARSYTSQSDDGSLIGAIFGTGTNGAYVERIANIPKLRHIKGPKSMVINMEWAAFDNDLNVLQNTQFDEVIDSQSINPGQQMFEKRVSGMFLGEILRTVLLELIQRANLFNRQSSEILQRHNGIDTSPMSIIAADNSVHLKEVARVISEQFQIPNPRYEDCLAVKLVSEAIVRRSARLAGVAISAVCDHTGRLKTATPEKPVDVGADGSLVQHYPGYVDMCLEACDEILKLGPDQRRIRVGIAKDGSGIGAALYLSRRENRY